MKFLVNKNVRVLSLDAMNTLIGLKESPGATYSRFGNEYGISANPEVLNQRFKQSFKDLDQQFPCYGFDSFGASQWWTKLIKQTFGRDFGLGDEESMNHLCSKLYDFYSTPEPWKLLENDAIEHLERIRSRDISICITSNFDSRLRSVLLDFDILNHIDFIALSGEVGKAKPDPEIFKEIMDYFTLTNPRDLLHIGDSLEKDYQGATDFGAQSCVYGSAESSKGVPCIDNLGDLEFEQ